MYLHMYVNNFSIYTDIQICTVIDRNINSYRYQNMYLYIYILCTIYTKKIKLIILLTFSQVKKEYYSGDSHDWCLISNFRHKHPKKTCTNHHFSRAMLNSGEVPLHLCWGSQWLANPHEIFSCHLNLRGQPQCHPPRQKGCNSRPN